MVWPRVSVSLHYGHSLIPLLYFPSKSNHTVQDTVVPKTLAVQVLVQVEVRRSTRNSKSARTNTFPWYSAVQGQYLPGGLLVTKMG